MRLRCAHRLLVVLFLLQSALWAQEDLEALAKRSPRDATKRVLAASTDDQAKAVASLLRHVEPNCRQTALSVLEATWNVCFIPSLRDVAGGDRSPQVRERAAKLFQTLTLYEPIAVEGATPEPDDVADPKASRWFRPVPMVVVVRDMGGRPVPGALVQAYAPEYGLCVPF
ncbi:MAG: hypothetical protein FJ279_15285, partial [Planctomycetes bacterium]|nr:hypothetical protein [Planctomycetota bacterium]